MNKSILLIIGGGISAYKCLELIRQLSAKGIKTRCIMTKAAHEFVTPMSVSALSGEKIFTELFDLTDEAEMGHIELSRSTDLLVVAPATADLMAKIVHGHANDLATTCLLASDKKILLAPAMNLRMWHHAATQRNIEQLKKDGAYFVGPNEGDMACGEFGLGRMAEPAEIVAAVEALLVSARPLAGKTVLITAGPTREPIDPVRFISNHSSGKQGYALAQAASEMGADVTLISGPVNLDTPPGVKRINVTTADEMLAACQSHSAVDLGIFCAAVADWKVANAASQKIKKKPGEDAPHLQFAQNPDILKTIAHQQLNRPQLVVGFAAETENLIANAREKLDKKGCDLIIANDVSKGVFGEGENTVHLISKTQHQAWPKFSKAEVAMRILSHCAGLLK